MSTEIYSSTWQCVTIIPKLATSIQSATTTVKLNDGEKKPFVAFDWTLTKQPCKNHKEKNLGFINSKFTSWLHF